MIVFKNYFKIIKNFLPSIIIYSSIFLFFAIMTTSFNDSNQFALSKPNVGIINKDDSLIVDTFIDYVSDNAKIIDISNDESLIKDALFYRQVDYVMIIPSGFGKSLLNNLDLKIETMKVPESNNSIYTEMLLNKFLNIAKIYSIENISELEMSSLIINDLKKSAEIIKLDENNSTFYKINYYYNFANYSILAVVILVIGMIINIYNNKNIKMRNLVSKTNYNIIQKQIVLGNIVVTFTLWLMYVVSSLILYSDAMFSYNGLLIIINSFLFSISALAIGTVVGNLVKNKEAQNGLVNVIALGSSFLCGSFVPQEYLGNTVLNIGKLFPSFWYIKNNNSIMQLSNVSIETIFPIIINMVIIIIYIILLFLISKFIVKFKIKNN